MGAISIITDIDINVNEGKVISFSTTGEGSGGFFSRGTDIDVIFWNDILKIGCDTIIASIGSEGRIDIDEMKF